MIVSMDLNASPVPEEDEDVFGQHVEEYSQYTAPDERERTESAVDIARRVLFFLLLFDLPAPFT
jgi:mRNA-capping enzyme